MYLIKKHLFIFCVAGLQFYSYAQDSTKLVTHNTKFNVSGRYISGTFNQLVIANSVDLKLKYKNWSISNTLSYRYNKTSNQIIEDNWYELLTISYRKGQNSFFPSFIYHYDNNLMFQVINRHLIGGGLSSQINWKKQQMRIDLGPGFEHTEYTTGQFENTNSMDPIRNRPLVISRLYFQNSFFNEKIILTNDFFYRHSLVEISDYLYLLSSEISLKVLKYFRFFTNYEFRYENVHLIDLSPVNSTLLFGLTFQLSNQ